MSDFTRKLVEAYRSGAQFACVDALIPRDEAQAYDVQAEVARALETTAAGWKVGARPHDPPFAAPLLRRFVYDDGARIALAEGEAFKLEVELALRLARDLPQRGAPYSRDEILEACASFVVGLELVRTRLLASPAPAFNASLADNFNNAGYVTGQEKPAKSATPAIQAIDLTRLRVRLYADGELIEDVTGSHALGDPMIPVVAWANGQVDRLGGLRAGQIITTGNLTKPFPVDRAMRIEGEIDALGRVTAQFG